MPGDFTRTSRAWILTQTTKWFDVQDRFIRSISSRMSSAYQHVHRADNFTGFGYLPDLTPAHQLLLLTGMIGGMPLLLSPRICHNRRSPYEGTGLIASVCSGSAAALPRFFSPSFSFREKSGRIAVSTSCVIAAVNWLASIWSLDFIVHPVWFPLFL